MQAPVYIIEHLYNKLMVVGGIGADHEVEIIDLRGENKRCRSAAPSPTSHGSTGVYFDGYPTICGGQDSNACFQYNREVGPSGTGSPFPLSLTRVQLLQ